MEIVPAARDASADIFRVVLEVDDEHGLSGLAVAHFAQPAVHMRALLGRGDKLLNCGRTDGHIVEIPSEANALGDHQIDEFIRGDCVDIRAGVAHGDAEQAALALEQIHRLHDMVVAALAASCVIAVFRALDADGERDISDSLHLFAELLVNEVGVRIGEERAVRMKLAELDEVFLPQERLAAGEHIEMGAHCDALVDNAVELIKSEALLVAVFRTPAALALAVARACRVEENDPRNIAVIFFAVCANGLCAVDSRAQSESEHHVHQNIVVDLIYKLERQLTPDVLGVFRALAEAVEVFRGEDVADKSLGSVNKLNKICVGVLSDIFYQAGQNRCGCCSLNLIFDRHLRGSFRFENILNLSK